MKNKIFKHLEKAKYGYLEITTPNLEKITIGQANATPKADIFIKDWSVIDLILLKGDIGFGQAYIKGLFTTNHLENLLLFICLNQAQFETLFHSNHLYSLIFNIKNLFKKNSLKGSQKNIQYHYDLGNDFYQLWLDDTMSYSSGIFCEANDLKKSQINKYERILNQFANGSDILEIGCGWGGFIHQAHAKNHKVKGLTLSHQQKSYSDQLIVKHHLNAKIHLQDYRLEKGTFDNIVSIEMFEAVGKKYWQDYFATLKNCLKKDGKAVIQTIVIDDPYYEKYAKTSDYIREYIFPGGFLPSPEIFSHLAKKNKLHIADNFSFGNCYSKTLLKWLENFNHAKNDIIKLGYSQEFIRKWQFYLAYCAASFSASRTNVVQYCLVHD